MAKKVVATLKKEGAGNEYVKVVKTMKSPKTGAYTFKEEIIPADKVKAFFAK
ncbi:MAG: DUF4295 domain-containing protein [Flavobacteriales bacterium]|nr:MAG: DUF4295 domain-containing protein [Flavobacteriales bacterium]PHX91876.1 MAG: DUF4295 domain-containing protein [Flavobacteriales bacterium]